MKVAFSLPFFVRSTKEERIRDINMLILNLESLNNYEDVLLVIYNQGNLSNKEIKALMTNYNINYDIIGKGENMGIPIARQKSFEHVWNNYPEIKYQGELHVDMIFCKDWYKPMIDYLENNKNEPMVSPAIITAYGAYSMDFNKVINIPSNLRKMTKILESFKVDKIINGLVHPVIHKSDILKDIGGIDLRFFRGKQGYEDYAILIGYYNYIGSKYKWKPKIYGISTVFHAVCQQRITVDNLQKDILINEEGLFHQFGATGFKILSEMLDDNVIMGPFYEKRVNSFVNLKF